MDNPDILSTICKYLTYQSIEELVVVNKSISRALISIRAEVDKNHTPRQPHGKVISKYGKCRYYHEGILHRRDDLPAVVHKSGTKYWFNRGYLHRSNNLPAKVFNNGQCEWFYWGHPYINKHEDILLLDKTNIVYHCYKYSNIGVWVRKRYPIS